MRRSATDPQLAGGPGLLRTAAYGLFAMPLAMAALPLYVHLPKFYGGHARRRPRRRSACCSSCCASPTASSTRCSACGATACARARVAIALSRAGAGARHGRAVHAACGDRPRSLLAWLVVALALVYTAYSVATINHNAWGAELSTDPVERTRITAIREGLALVGVVVASVAPALLGGAAGPDAGLAPLRDRVRGRSRSPAPRSPCARRTRRAAPRRALEPLATRVAAPLADPLFRRLLAVFLANGIASAIPATLVLFFIADVLQAESAAGPLSRALLRRRRRRHAAVGPSVRAPAARRRAWMVGMVAAIVAFVWAFALGPGDAGAFAAICVLSGLALGADLALPPSLLADVIDRDGRARPTGAYFGLWTLATKLNLALAAGIALPLLGAPGLRARAGPRGGGLGALAFVYAVVALRAEARRARRPLPFRNRRRAGTSP